VHHQSEGVPQVIPTALNKAVPMQAAMNKVFPMVRRKKYFLPCSPFFLKIAPYKIDR
jgi:hypothetical protein